MHGYGTNCFGSFAMGWKVWKIKGHEDECLKEIWDGTFTIRYKELINGGFDIKGK